MPIFAFESSELIKTSLRRLTFDFSPVVFPLTLSEIYHSPLACCALRLASRLSAG